MGNFGRTGRFKISISIRPYFYFKEHITKEDQRAFSWSLFLCYLRRTMTEKERFCGRHVQPGQRVKKFYPETVAVTLSYRTHLSSSAPGPFGYFFSFLQEDALGGCSQGCDHSAGEGERRKRKRKKKKTGVFSCHSFTIKNILPQIVN